MKCLTSIHRYPIKSSMGISLEESKVEKRGLAFDRRWCIFDKNEKALTAREFPQMLDIEAVVSGQELLICYRNETVGRIPLVMPPDDYKPVKVFSYDAQGVSTSSDINRWLTDFLGKDCQLLFHHDVFKRPVLTKHGGAPDDIVGFADQCPILLATESSLADLNRRMECPVEMGRFRPNLVVKGTEAWEEDNWKVVKIGECEFKVNQPCIRCVLTTIDPVTKLKDPNTEPLRTMRTFRDGPKGGVVFGMHLTPITEGMIRLEDSLVVLK